MEFSFTPEQRQLRDHVLRFARKEIVPRVREHDLAGTFDHASWRRLGEMGILGLHLPPEYGGSGASVLSCVVVGEALGEAGVDGGLALSYGAPATVMDGGQAYCPVITIFCAESGFAMGMTCTWNRTSVEGSQAWLIWRAKCSSSA